LAKTKEESVSRGGFIPTINFDLRDLQAADLSGADLRSVSLQGAKIQGALLGLARLDGARLSGARLEGANLEGTKLSGADIGVWLEGDRSVPAQLQAADLKFAQLQGTNLSKAQLPGADLLSAHLQGANLSNAQLQGAQLSQAFLQGADLSDAQMQGADFSRADLRGTRLKYAQAQGASLLGADLAYVWLDGTYVFGLNRHEVKNLSRSAIGVNAHKVWRNADLIEAYRHDLDGGFHADPAAQPLGEIDVGRWRAAATQFATGRQTQDISARLAPLSRHILDDDWDEAGEITWWHDQAVASESLDPDGAHRIEGLASFLGDLGCDSDGAPYVARALIAWQPALRDRDNQFEGPRKRFKAGREKPETCPGVAGFSEEDWRKLDAIKPN
jgi:uncharacterized protein YjbI with pentapeptide repeats